MHTHLIFGLDHGVQELRFRDIRRFGSVTLFAGPSGVRRVLSCRGLGPEPFDLDHGYWRAALAKTSRCLKAILARPARRRRRRQYLRGRSSLRSQLGAASLGKQLARAEADRLRRAIVTVLLRGIDKRGSSIRNYVGGSGLRGSYQKSSAPMAERASLAALPDADRAYPPRRPLHAFLPALPAADLTWPMLPASVVQFAGEALNIHDEGPCPTVPSNVCLARPASNASAAFCSATAIFVLIALSFLLYAYQTEHLAIDQAVNSCRLLVNPSLGHRSFEGRMGTPAQIKAAIGMLDQGKDYQYRVYVESQKDLDSFERDLFRDFRKDLDKRNEDVRLQAQRASAGLFRAAVGRQILRRVPPSCRGQGERPSRHHANPHADEDRSRRRSTGIGPSSWARRLGPPCSS